MTSGIRALPSMRLVFRNGGRACWESRWRGNCFTKAIVRSHPTTTVRDRRDDTSVVSIEGPLRAPLRATVRHAVHALLREGERNIVLSLARVIDLDAAGVGELVRAYNITKAAGGVLRIAYASGWAREVLARVGLLDFLEQGSHPVVRHQAGGHPLAQG